MNYHWEVVKSHIDSPINITTGHRVVDKLMKRNFNTNPNPSKTRFQNIPLPEGNIAFLLLIKYLF